LQIDKKFLILLFRILKGVSPAGTNGISADGQAEEQSPSCRAYRPAAAGTPHPPAEGWSPQRGASLTQKRQCRRGYTAPPPRGNSSPPRGMLRRPAGNTDNIPHDTVFDGLLQSVYWQTRTQSTNV